MTILYVPPLRQTSTTLSHYIGKGVLMKPLRIKLLLIASCLYFFLSPTFYLAFYVQAEDHHSDEKLITSSSSDTTRDTEEGSSPTTSSYTYTSNANPSTSSSSSALSKERIRFTLSVIDKKSGSELRKGEIALEVKDKNAKNDPWILLHLFKLNGKRQTYLYQGSSKNLVFRYHILRFPSDYTYEGEETMELSSPYTILINAQRNTEEVNQHMERSSYDFIIHTVPPQANVKLLLYRIPKVAEAHAINYNPKYDFSKFFASWKERASMFSVAQPSVLTSSTSLTSSHHEMSVLSGYANFVSNLSNQAEPSMGDLTKAVVITDENGSARINDIKSNKFWRLVRVAGPLGELETSFDHNGVKEGFHGVFGVEERNSLFDENVLAERGQLLFPTDNINQENYNRESIEGFNTTENNLIEIHGPNYINEDHTKFVFDVFVKTQANVDLKPAIQENFINTYSTILDNPDEITLDDEELIQSALEQLQDKNLSELHDVREKLETALREIERLKNQETDAGKAEILNALLDNLSKQPEKEKIDLIRQVIASLKDPELQTLFLEQLDKKLLDPTVLAKVEQLDKLLEKLKTQTPASKVDVEKLRELLNELSKDEKVIANFNPLLQQGREKLKELESASQPIPKPKPVTSTEGLDDTSTPHASDMTDENRQNTQDKTTQKDNEREADSSNSSSTENSSHNSEDEEGEKADDQKNENDTKVQEDTMVPNPQTNKSKVPKDEETANKADALNKRIKELEEKIKELAKLQNMKKSLEDLQNDFIKLQAQAEKAGKKKEKDDTKTELSTVSTDLKDLQNRIEKETKAVESLLHFLEKEKVKKDKTSQKEENTEKNHGKSNAEEMHTNNSTTQKTSDNTSHQDRSENLNLSEPNLDEKDLLLLESMNLLLKEQEKNRKTSKQLENLSPFIYTYLQKTNESRRKVPTHSSTSATEKENNDLHTYAKKLEEMFSSTPKEEKNTLNSSIHTGDSSNQIASSTSKTSSKLEELKERLKKLREENNSLTYRDHVGSASPQNTTLSAEKKYFSTSNGKDSVPNTQVDSVSKKNSPTFFYLSIFLATFCLFLMLGVCLREQSKNTATLKP